MYHYIRELIESKYPKIKALNTTEFIYQIEYISKNYQFLTLEDVRSAIKGDKCFENGVVLTFDDGYADHYNNVFPILNKLGIQGWFFPPVNAVTTDAILDVNKIHFILASIPEGENLINLLLETTNHLHKNKDLESYLLNFWKDFNFYDAYDRKEVTFFKHVLQNYLDEDLRIEIVDYLFSRFVDEDIKTFSSNLYMNIDQLIEMNDSGMVIGGHGAKHIWLGKSSENEQIDEITKTRNFLEKINDDEDFVMCYPYGSYNDFTLHECNKQGFDLGLTTIDGVFDPCTGYPLTIERKDTNCFPKTKQI
ncbi:MAG: polysaccharide deacetylase [Opitutae bacterium]|nr:polysaccharide deacetylase [Opitutae bacterium]